MTGNLDILKRDIMSDIYQNRMLLTVSRDKKEGWTLISGLWSPFYIQLRLLSSYPETLKKIGRAMTTLLNEKAPNVNKVVGVAFAGIPIATAISIESGLPACHTRKMLGVRTEEDLLSAIKEYGQHSLLEGVVEDGDVLCIVDDLVTGMESKLIARAQVQAEIERRGVQNVTCDDVAVVLNRQQGAKKKANEAGIRLHSLIDFVDEGLPLLQDSMDSDEYNLISNYLTDPSKHQPK
ncbi:MAG: orotate phosphoribosyltransferase [Candidatus Thorarchaeota archaeon]|jgi:orotate phosphoribosyltransferase